MRKHMITNFIIFQTKAIWTVVLKYNPDNILTATPPYFPEDIDQNIPLNLGEMLKVLTLMTCPSSSLQHCFDLCIQGILKVPFSRSSQSTPGKVFFFQDGGATIPEVAFFSSRVKQIK